MSNRFTFTEKLLSYFTRLNPGEGVAAWLLIANSFFLLYSHYLLKVVRETLILSGGTAVDKAMANALSAIAVGFVVFAYTEFYKRYRSELQRSLLSVLLNAFFFVNIILFVALISADIRTPVIFYIWQSVYGVLVVSHFWSYCSDLMNQKTGQRLFPLIMVGASLGAWSGSASAEWFNSFGINGVMIAALCCLLIATWFSVVAEQRLPLGSKNLAIAKDQDPAEYSVFAGFELVFQKRYLLYIALFVLLMNWINTMGEFIFASFVKDAAKAAMAADSSLIEDDLITHYYSSYYSWISLCGFLMQAFLVSRLFLWIGVQGSLFVLPVVMIVGYGVLSLIPLFAVARISMIAENSTSYSIANTTRAALYLPLSPEEKYLGKTTIDTFFWRLGDLIQYVAITIGINWFAWKIAEFVWLNLALSVVMLYVTMKIFRLYEQRDRVNETGNPPVIRGEVPTFELVSGCVMRGSIPEDLFYDPDPGDALRYQLTKSNGEQLPSWIHFDPHNLLVSFHPPAGESGNMDLKLRVSDVDELDCETDIHVSWKQA